MKVWIDLSNSPHPLLFAPIERRLRERGHDVFLTARDNAQTVELARRQWADVAVIGGASPAGRRAKAAALLSRVLELRRAAAAAGVEIALSHNSYAQILAARLLGLPVVTAMDYEHQPANHLAFRLAHAILLPSQFPLEAARRQGARRGKVHVYPGPKERLYVAEFEFDDRVLARLGIERRPGDVLAVLRAPPSRATYHRLENPLYDEALASLASPGVHGVVLTRHPEQRAALRALDLPDVVVPDAAVDGRSLAYAADVVIGAGGTMTREAALLGVPTISIFAGRPAAVDVWLEREGMLRIVRPGERIGPLRPRPEPPPDLERLRSDGRTQVEAFATAVELVYTSRRSPTASRSKSA